VLLDERAEPRPERCIVGRAGDEANVGGARGEKRSTAILGDSVPGIRDPRFERARIRRGAAVEDEYDDTGHRGSLSSRGRALTRRVRAYVGLGANVGDPDAAIAAGIHALGALPGARVRGVSRLYATAPVGVVDQPEFRNAAVAIDVPAGPDPATGAVALLIALKDLERAFGRQDRERWGPRELDLDLLVFGRHRIDVARPPAARSSDPAKPSDLVVPHRLAGERLFVLAPLTDLAPRLVPPGWRETVESARRRREAVEGAAAVRPIAAWDGSGWRPIEAPEGRQPR
jgi:2-amino-4-hydroxy-6-hydroxymethyldihydropteridine diphosphokinase